MQKFIITLLALASSCVYAETKNFEDIPERLMEEVMYASSFTGKNPPEINVADLQLGVGTGRNRIFMGGKSEHKGALTTNLLQDTKKSEACTISFDLHKVAGQPGQVIWGLYSPDRAFEHGLRLVIGPRRTLELVCTNFTESNVSGRSAKIKLGEIEDLLGKTLTIVYDGELDEVNAYINGQRIDATAPLYDGDVVRFSTHMLQFAANTEQHRALQGTAFTGNVLHALLCQHFPKRLFHKCGSMDQSAGQ